METIRVDSYEDALSEVRKRKATPDGARLSYKIAKSGYGEYVVVAIEPDVLADILVGDLPAIPGLRKIFQAPDYSV